MTTKFVAVIFDHGEHVIDAATFPEAAAQAAHLAVDLGGDDALLEVRRADYRAPVGCSGCGAEPMEDQHGPAHSWCSCDWATAEHVNH